MIKYVIDNNIFSRTFKNVPLDVFDDIWIPWSDGMEQGKILSVDEVMCELLNRWGDDKEEGKWLIAHKQYFYKPTNEEGYYLREIFKNPKFREGIKEKSLRDGTPEADAMLVAKAKVVDAIVVTAESDEKPNSEKIPNIASSFGVPYMNINNFYRLLRNISNGRDEMQDVFICNGLRNQVSLAEYIKK